MRRDCKAWAIRQQQSPPAVSACRMRDGVSRIATSYMPSHAALPCRIIPAFPDIFPRAPRHHSHTVTRTLAYRRSTGPPSNVLALSSFTGEGLGVRQQWRQHPLPESGPSHSKSGIRVRPAPVCVTRRGGSLTELPSAPTSALRPDFSPANEPREEPQTTNDRLLYASFATPLSSRKATSAPNLRPK